MPAILQALIYLINAVFDIYIFVLIIRLILAWTGADYSLPITQMIVKMTSFAVKPLKKFIPDYRGVEIATVVLILVVDMVKYILMICLSFGFSHIYSIFGIVLLAIADPVKWLIEILFYAILFQAILSWLQPNTQINRVLTQFTSPILRPLQRFIPPVNGVDVSPIPALIILQLLIILIIDPFLAKGWSIALG